MKKIFIITIGAGFILSSLSCVNKVIQISRNYPSFDVNELIRPEFRLSGIPTQAEGNSVEDVKNVSSQLKKNKPGSIKKLRRISEKAQNFPDNL